MRTFACLSAARKRFLLLVLCFLATAAPAVTISAGSGTLSFTENISQSQCFVIIGNRGSHVNYNIYNYSGFSYTVSGVTTPLAGGVKATQGSPAIQGCPQNSSPSISWDVFSTPVFPYTTQGETTITFASVANQATVTTASLTPGIIYPKYQVQSIIYDTPGNSSSNGFTNSETDGTNTSVGNSFQASDTTTFSLSTGFLGLGSTISWSSGNSTTVGNSIAVTQTITDATGVASASNHNGPNSINHQQDLFIIWLNPAVVVYQTGQNSVGYFQGTQLQTAGDPHPGEPEAYQDQIEVTAQAMMANSQGATSVPVSILEPVKMPDGETLPGLAVICANPQFYPNSCTQANQCGCVPSDFAGILALDPLLNFSPTESPLNADTSGPAACANPTSADSCRYVPVSTAPGSGVQETELLEGPNTPGGIMPVNSFTQTDSTVTTQTLTESQSYTVGSSTEQSFKFLGNGISIRSANQWTWTNSESTGAITGRAHSMAVTFSSSTVGCDQEIPIFEDSIYHTFVFQQPSGNTSCP